MDRQFDQHEKCRLYFIMLMILSRGGGFAGGTLMMRNRPLYSARDLSRCPVVDRGGGWS